MAGFELANLAVVMVVMVAAYMQFHTTVAKTSHIVGGPVGWTTPPLGSPLYTTWAKRGTFNVGDDLIFKFTTGKHTVAEVSTGSLDRCNASDSLDKVFKTEPATITLRHAGPRNFVCTIHCKQGQKFSLIVK